MAVKHVRTLPRIGAFLAFLGSAALVGLAAQPPDEKEDPKAKIKKKIAVDDDPDGKKSSAPAGIAPDVRLDELVRAADGTREGPLKALFTKYTVPFDRVSEKSGATRVKPVPVLKTEWPESVRLTPLDNGGKPQEDRAAKTADVRIEYFEAMVLADVENLLKQKPEGEAQLDQLAGAEKLLAAAMRFHDYAREHPYPDRKIPIRNGKAWDELRTPLQAKLREVRLETLRVSMAANDTARVREASARLMNAYPKDAAVAQAVAVARVGEAARLMESGAHADLVRAKEIIDEFEARYPGAGGENARKIRAQIRDVAQKAFTRAREKKAVGDLTTARDELSRASALDPTIDGLRDLQRELRIGYPILTIGVHQFPVNLSPTLARLDSEKQAVELLFEGLLEEVPQENGAVTYRPGAALAMPLAVPGGREFTLRSFDRDEVGRPGFESHDVVGTVKMLRERPETWAAHPLAWLSREEPPVAKDASGVRVSFGIAHPDPRALLTFKLLPTRWMNDNGKSIDDGGFSEKPFGTGPFRLQAKTNPPAGVPREMIFVDNPNYGRWRDRAGLPQLREIRMIEAAKLDPIAAFGQDKLHILPDIPTSDIDKFSGAGSGLAGKVRVVTPLVNRRVHILAINLARPYLQNRLLRQGLSLAIDRDEVLRDVYRAGKTDFHRAMTSPYPPGSWAGPRGVSGGVPLMNRDLAVGRLKAYLEDVNSKLDFTLSYPEGDPHAAAACARIKAHVEGLLKDSPRKLILTLEPVPLRDLMTRVQDEHRYDLAYVPLDYPDDWHPFALGAMLDPSAAVRGGRNWFSFLVRETNPSAEDQDLGKALNELRYYRDPNLLAARALEAAKLFNDSMPFIPLWQLDRHMVIHNSVKVYVDDTPEPANPRVLNPTLLFQGVARWKLE